MTSPETGDAGQLRLHCFGGEIPSREVMADAERFLSLPESARRRIWDLLGPSLGDSIPAEVRSTFDRFVAAHGADPDALANAVKLARTLVRQASALDVTPERFTEDLTRLAGGRPEIAEAIAPGYARAKKRLRTDIAVHAVADHGRVLESIRWRVDVMRTSDRGLALRMPVVMLTLHYREGARRDQFSIQILPHLLGQLRSLCDHVLGRR